MAVENTFLLQAQVLERVQIKTTALYALMGRNEFPKPFKLDGKRNAWLTTDIDGWLEARAARRGIGRTATPPRQ